MKKFREAIWYVFVGIVAIVLAYVICSQPVRAETSVEVGAGVTHYGTYNGRWFQNGAPGNKVTSNAPAFSLGLTGDIVSRGDWGVDWHAEYVNLGRSAAQCQCKTRDEDYAGHSKGQTAWFSGSGRAQGVALTLEPYAWRGGLRWGIEAVAYIYHADWNQNVYGWAVNESPKRDLSLGSHTWNVAPVLGATVGNGKWSVSYRHYFMRLNSQRSNVPPVWNDADVIEAKWRF